MNKWALTFALTAFLMGSMAVCGAGANTVSAAGNTQSAVKHAAKTQNPFELVYDGAIEKNVKGLNM